MSPPRPVVQHPDDPRDAARVSDLTTKEQLDLEIASHECVWCEEQATKRFKKWGSEHGAYRAAIYLYTCDAHVEQGLKAIQKRSWPRPKKTFEDVRMFEIEAIDGEIQTTPRRRRAA